jgi:hypothetical protein
MDRKKLLTRIIFLIFFIFLINYLAQEFYWYSSIWYFDMPMHFLGGFWLGLVSLYLFPSEDRSWKYIFKVFFTVLLIGIGWEIFEILIDKFITFNNFNSLDTLSDLFFDLAGGLSAVFYFFRRTMSILENTV